VLEMTARKQVSLATRKRLSESHLGKHTSVATEFKKGHGFSEQVLEKIRKTKKGQHSSPRTKFKKGDHPSLKTEFKKGNHPKSEFKKGHKESSEVKERRMKNVMRGLAVKPNQKEKQLHSFLQCLLPQEFALNVKAEIMILGGKIPDFVNVNGQKKIIELYGNYWHKHDNPQDRIDYFKQFGWDTLIIWEKELKDESLLGERILRFYNGGVKLEVEV